MAKLPSRALETDVTSRPSAAELQLTPLLNQAPASETPACAWPAPPTARAKRDAARVMRARRIMVSPSGRGWTSRRWARRRVGRRASLLCRLQRAPGWEVTPGRRLRRGSARRPRAISRPTRDLPGRWHSKDDIAEHLAVRRTGTFAPGYGPTQRRSGRALSR